ncbi:MAG: Lon protease, partial [candidate division CPR1 bacterium GW2011_GWA2_42_17]
NVLDTIQPALRDRMEIIKLAGYTLEEKMEIAKRHLLSKVMSENGLTQDLVEFEKGALAKIISNYTWEAGIRNLERQLSKISRKIAHKMALRKTGKVIIRERDLEKYLGPKKVFLETKRDVWGPGVVTGLAWTAAGGVIQFVEVTAMPGKKGFALTGQMGEVMKESAQTALSLVRTRAESLKIDKNFFEKMDLHIHVPEGAVQKDGPSAGVTMVCALVSLLTKKAVRQDVAMTGEVTLSGLVLPIGGLKEKILAAKRAGIKTIIIPKKNEGDLKEIDEPLKKGLKFVLVGSIDQVLKEAF